MRSPFIWIAKLPIMFYRKFISPLLPPSCKYYPSCSSYALDAYEKHGLIKGTVLTVWRLLRCNPWSLGGVDYVPERVTVDYFRIKKVRKK
ncbi:MAG: membrane protein insertion efficiency factor YidD [Ruminococcus sp.]|nr:membrane protein insertion efficiency factor YidD [Ruminococcus sp.]MBQ1432484.1 membrane protein insertion efficiency factor YidD [Ruminococcus sp.]